MSGQTDPSSAGATGAGDGATPLPETVLSSTAPSDSPFKRYRDQTVLGAARERLDYIYDEFENVYLSVSGGKDSSVTLQLAAEVARERPDDPTVDVLIVDLEAQYRATIDHLHTLLDTTADVVGDVWWVCLPLSLRNAVSQLQPKWTCWHPEKRDEWVRAPPDRESVVTLVDHPFGDHYELNMEFEEFIDAFARWYDDRYDGPTAAGIAIRSNESLNRFRSLLRTDTESYDGRFWTTRVAVDSTNDEYLDVWNVYPIYDWRVEDVWAYVARQGLPYNEVYERMWQNGLSIHEQRICQPYGDDQRNGLDQFRAIEPETWEKVLNRVAGANFGNIYARTSLLGEFDSEKPDHLSWEEYAVFLLESIGLYCPELRDHYTEKIRSFIEWYEDAEYEETGWTAEMGVDDIPDAHPDDLPKRGYPSWERIAWAIERNDFWMKRLGFSQTKGGREKLQDLREKYGDGLADPDQIGDKHLREWAEDHADADADGDRDGDDQLGGGEDGE